MCLDNLRPVRAAVNAEGGRYTCTVVKITWQGFANNAVLVPSGLPAHRFVHTIISIAAKLVFPTFL
jgi:hypothetical protein